MSLLPVNRSVEVKESYKQFYDYCQPGKTQQATAIKKLITGHGMLVGKVQTQCCKQAANTQYDGF